MADNNKGIGETKKCRTYAKNLATQPREFKVGGKWYKWNACGTEGDTLDVTNVKLGEYAKYFEIKEK